MVNGFALSVLHQCLRWEGREEHRLVKPLTYQRPLTARTYKAAGNNLAGRFKTETPGLGRNAAKPLPETAILAPTWS